MYESLLIISNNLLFPFDLIYVNKHLDVMNYCYIEPISVSLEWSIELGLAVIYVQLKHSNIIPENYIVVP